MNTTYAVILAGGVGSRFWPLSREAEPKQFLQFMGDRSLLQETIARVASFVPPENIYIISNEQYKFQIQHQVANFKVPAGNLILEPQGKNTAPAVGLAAGYIYKRDPDAVMVVLPADHHIGKPQKLAAIFKGAVETARADKLVTIGIVPTSAHTGYGYIKIKSQRLKVSRSQAKACPVEKFVEKPDKKKAERFFKDKKYFWNAGMFVWKAQVILDEIKAYLPELYRTLALLSQSREFDARVWAKIHPISIDYGVLEKSKRVVVIPAKDLDWSDLGSWSSYCKVCARDKKGNVLKGDSVDVDSRDIAVFGKGRLVATIGLKDVIVVDTDDALLVCHKDRTEDVKRIVEHIRSNNRPEHAEHKTVKRPWGSYAVINMGNGFKVKVVQIDPHKRLSLQRHFHRSEHWVVVEGEAKITIDRDTYFRGANQSIYVPKKGTHRLENATDKPLKIVEVQCGSYLEEDDIERLSDDFMRR
ncbi:MAG: mannose-1-phosphate guanylyltransferase/mannose-6-phosphate isomerase [Candidatus Omnitrophica bacterium]|nr:mannose-1-phosphate guanylyltransferase/mannose-6-phosphate isomerase [Candidatus Omnitrophota bacterium]